MSPRHWVGAMAPNGTQAHGGSRGSKCYTRKPSASSKRLMKKPCVSSRFKQTSASSANGDNMMKKPCVSYGEKEASRWAGLRMQIHGFRIACGSDKAEVVRKELQVLWRSREWSAEEWQLAAAQHTAETKMEKMRLGWRPISP